MAVEVLKEGGSGNRITPPTLIHGDGFEGDHENMLSEVDRILRASAEQLKLGEVAIEQTDTKIAESQETVRSAGPRSRMPEVLGVIVARRAAAVRYN
jgi:ABC-type Fe2+-enterobactin transport system substrate-binding protein